MNATNAVTPTRYPELGIAQHGPGLWRIVTDGDHYAATGPQYKSKAEALADLDRFAAQYGATGAAPDPYARIAELEAQLARAIDGNRALTDQLARVTAQRDALELELSTIGAAADDMARDTPGYSPNLDRITCACVRASRKLAALRACEAEGGAK